MKIVRFAAENYKRLVAVEITPDGNAVLITGKNGAGKSSVLDGIASTLQGKKYQPKKPIREGEDHAETIVETENWIIKRTYTATGGGSVTVKNKDGMTGSSPQGLLDKIVGEIAFDPMLFIRQGDTVAGEREQLRTVMRLAGLDFSDIDAKIAQTKADRSDVRRDKERFESQARDIAVAEGTPDEEVSVADLVAALQTVNDEKAFHEKARRELGATEDALKNVGDKQAGIATEIAALKTQVEKLEASEKHYCELAASLTDQVGKQQVEFDAYVASDISIIEDDIANVEETNTSVRSKKQKADLTTKAEAEAEKWRMLGKKMKKLDAQKAKRLADAKMPLEGMSVTADGVIIDGIPLSQVNDAKKLEVGMGIAMAENPELRVILMKGNDLDEDSLKVVSKMAEDKDYMLWIERIEGEGGIVIEDGSAKE